MKPFAFKEIGLSLCALMLGVGSLRAVVQPVITSIGQDASNLVIQVMVPAGIQRITLESRERLGSGAWAPRAVARLEAAGGQVVFKLPKDKSLELLRARADEEDPLPSSFYSGPTSFNGAASGTPNSGPPYVFNFNGGPVIPGPVTEDPGGSSREVQESDIWMIRGSRLYFFNQLRGLQIIDLTNPDAPEVLGTLPLPGVGEKMYVGGERHVVLLAREGCEYNTQASRVLVVEDRDGSPVVVASLPVAGSIQESRMVGTALYVASHAYQRIASAEGAWEWGTHVSSFDLSNPANPIARGTLFIPGYANVVSATDVLFFVVTQDPASPWRSLIRTIDITSPDGSMRAYETVRLAGVINDKFKLNYAGQIFTGISEDRGSDGARRLVTRLETFRLADPRSAGPGGVSKLGELELGAGERLHATRFDGDRVYVVTFFQIDPLWVVSLTDPARPRIVGHLEVPGWSTFIEPLGDRLVAIGIEASRAAVSLFDVSNPAQPALADKVLLGENYSHSEANWDEKALGVFPEQGLILVPYSGYTSNGYASRVQLIDLREQDLTARGVIEHALQPRRATVFGDRILSLSGWELLTVDASDRDLPVVRGRLELAWSVDRVLLHGEHLLQMGDSSAWQGEQPPTVRVSLADSPDAILEELALSGAPIMAAAIQDDYLYVAQGNSGRFFPYYLESVVASGTAHDQSVVLTVIDLSGLPELVVAGRVEAETETGFFSGQAQMVWPQEDVLVLAGTQHVGWWFNSPVGVFPGGVVSGAALYPYPFWGGQNGHLLAFDVRDPAAPAFSSEVALSDGDGWWNFGSAFATNGLVYISHEAGEFVASTPDSSAVVPGQDPGLIYPYGFWLWRTYLSVVDFADPTDPMIRKPVNIPGALVGISRGGALLYTVGQQWNQDGQGDGREYLSVSAYDGVAAHLVDSLPLAREWPHPVQIVAENIFVGVPGIPQGTEPVAPSSLESWTLPEAGKLVRVGAVGLEQAAQTLAAFDGLLAAQLSGQSVALIDIRDPAALDVIGLGTVPGCIWVDLKRADGAVERGLWVPLGPYGVGKIGLD